MCEGYSFYVLCVPSCASTLVRDENMVGRIEYTPLFQVVLAGAFYPNYFTFGQPDEEMAVRELAGKDPKTTVMVRDMGRCARV